MTRYYCDRCEREVPDEVLTTVCSMKRMHERDQNNYLWPMKTRTQLCEACVKEFNETFKAVPV